MKKIFCIFFVLCCCLGTAQDIRSLADKLILSTVEIFTQETKDDKFISTGTGWVFSNDTVVTANHVVDGFETIDPKNKKIIKSPYYAIKILFHNNEHVITNKIKKSPEYDIAVISFNFKNSQLLSPLKLATEKPNIGDFVCGGGFPLEYRFIFFSGKVTGYHKNVFQDNPAEFFSLDAIFTYGHSGSPIINKDGNVVGMADWIDKRSASLNFSITLDNLKKIII